MLSFPALTLHVETLAVWNLKRKKNMKENIAWFEPKKRNLYNLFFIWNFLLESKLDQQYCSIWSFLFQAVLPRLEIVAWGCYEYGHPADWLALKGLWQYSTIPFQSSVLHKAEYLVHVSHQWPGAFCMRCYMLARDQRPEPQWVQEMRGNVSDPGETSASIAGPPE